ncbi:MAG: hypothetical protein MUF34_24660 [Polyangiaceae bacterium]|nr:hypothetical protein [Polyangiaceae bacterium]
MKLRLLSCLTPLLFVAACGSLPDDPSETEGLATLQGELTNQTSLPLDGNVRIAVIWRRPEAGGQITFSVAEDVPVEPVFPSKFRVVLRNAPPESAMVNIGEIFGHGGDGGTAEPQPVPTEPAIPQPAPAAQAANALRQQALAAALQGRGAGLKAQDNDSPWPADLRVATGSLVAYVDDNQNGRLDLVEEGAPGFLDRVVATNPDLILAYFEGTIPDPFPSLEVPPALGYNLIPIGCDDVPVSDTGDSTGNGQPLAVRASGCESPRPMPASEPFQLPVTSDPGLNDLMCKNGGQQGSGSISGYGGPQPVEEQPAVYPTPGDRNLTCDPGGASYYFVTCETFSEGLCKGVTTNCTGIGYQRPDPAPAAWPCPTTP